MDETLTEGAPRRSEAEAQTDRKQIVLFVGADPDEDPGPLETAYHFARVAAGAGLDAEVRVAARGVRWLEEGRLEGPPEGAGLTACPASMKTHGITPEQAAAVGARTRGLAEILTEVAEGRAVLIPVTHRIDYAPER